MSKRSAVFGTKKDNVLTGTDDPDILFGKKGNDTLHGLGGNDKLFGGKGNDLLEGGADNDSLFGGKGKDELFGGGGDDKLFGGKGKDKLFGGEGNDKLFGGKGNDFLDGGAGDDYLFGGKGNDTFNFSMSENVDAKDFYDGGKGRDTLQLTLTTAQLSLESVQKDIANFEAFLASKANSHKDDGALFHFESFNLTVRNIEALEIVEVGGGNAAPVAVDDTLENLTATRVVSPIKVAVIGGAGSSVDEAVAQLKDSTVFDFTATSVPYTNSRDWSDLTVSNYHVVVLGDSGGFDYLGETGALFAALNSFVSAGGGVVTTGWFASALSNNALSPDAKLLADRITPIAQGWTDSDLGWTLFGPIDVTVSDTTHEIVKNVPLDVNNVYAYDSQYHEFAPLVVDAGAERLATGVSIATDQRTAIAYAEGVGQTTDMPGGRTVYLGGTYLANASGYGTGLGTPIRSPDGVSDLIFEQAIAWAAGARTGGAATVSIDPAKLLENDKDVDSPRDGFTFESFTQPGLEGASIAFVNGILVYTLGAQGLADLQAGIPVTDSFDYTMSDGQGGFDTASVALSIDNLL